VLGPRLGPAVKDLRTALGKTDPAEALAVLERGGTFEVPLPGSAVQLGQGDIELRIRSQPGFTVSREGGEVVALELELTDDLRRRGTAREVVRQVQDFRKARGFDVSDRIFLWLIDLDDLEPLFGYIAGEVLAVEVRKGEPETLGAEHPGRIRVELELESWPGRPAAVIERA
jgi:isoleucyl-tRNA synthetase